MIFWIKCFKVSWRHPQTIEETSEAFHLQKPLMELAPNPMTNRFNFNLELFAVTAIRVEPNWHNPTLSIPGWSILQLYILDI